MSVPSPTARSKITPCASTALAGFPYRTRYIAMPRRCCRLVPAAASTLTDDPNCAAHNRMVSIGVAVGACRTTSALHYMCIYYT